MPLNPNHPFEVGLVEQEDGATRSVSPAPVPSNESSGKFDRLTPTPPNYLLRLRSPGGWRTWRADGDRNKIKRSEALRSLRWNLENRGVFLDAGCGKSPDAACAVYQMGFKRAYKVDLWPPSSGNPWFDKRMAALEGRRVEFIQGDICKLSDLVPLNSVDLIGCNAAIDLMCLADRSLFYQEAEMVLAPGGVLIVHHIPLAAGHRDWIHGFEELEQCPMNLALLSATQSLLAVRKEPVVGIPTTQESSSKSCDAASTKGGGE